MGDDWAGYFMSQPILPRATSVPARRVAVAIPARNEAAWIEPCLARLLALEHDDRVASFRVVVLANDCSDDTAERAQRMGGAVEVIQARLPSGQAHAGGARRAAFEAAADLLRSAGDVLLSTDADTHVADDWLLRTLDHIDAGHDAVAGLARFKGAELRGLDRAHRVRLAQLRRYYAALDGLRGDRGPDEPWPRHFYEGGASMALTLGRYRQIGGAPAPPVGEDKALFEAVRASGGRVRHPLDVKVFTSCRLAGRATGGTSDTLDLWGRQGLDDPIHEVQPLNVALGLAMSGQPLTFAGLPAETDKARALLRAGRNRALLAEVG
jgi:hypothetical protein